MKREYCYKAVLNNGYILYIVHVAQYYVYCTNKDRTHNFCVYGGYKNLGTASNRLLQSARSYKTNDVSYYYAPKELFDKNGAFGFQN